MGTSSLLRIMRKKHADIYLWAHWDGYFDCGGKLICEQLCELLRKHTHAEVCSMVENMKVAYREDEAFDESMYYGGSFCYDNLAMAVSTALPGARAGSLTGTVRNDPCYDFQYKYVLDTYAGVLSGRGASGATPVLLTFESIRVGADFRTHDVDDEDAKARILDVCRTSVASDAVFDAHRDAFIEAIDEKVTSERSYCLREWTEYKWLKELSSYAPLAAVLQPVLDAHVEGEKMAGAGTLASL